MEIKNNDIIYEYLLINSAIHSSRAASMEDPKNVYGFSIYNSQMKGCYIQLLDEYSSILGIVVNSEDELFDYCQNLQITKEQRMALLRVKNDALFIKLLGESSLANKEDLEQLLGCEFSIVGKTITDKNGAHQEVKSWRQIEKEFAMYYENLDDLFQMRKINHEQYQRYREQLDHIYLYYLSISKGEQVKFRKRRDIDYQVMEKQNIESFKDNFDTFVETKNEYFTSDNK